MTAGGEGMRLSVTECKKASELACDVSVQKCALRRRERAELTYLDQALLDA